MSASDAGWSSLVARRAHNPKVAGSNPAPATIETSGRRALVHRAQAPDQRFRVRAEVEDLGFSGLFIGTCSAFPYAALCRVAPRTQRTCMLRFCGRGFDRCGGAWGCTGHALCRCPNQSLGDALVNEMPISDGMGPAVLLQESSVSIRVMPLPNWIGFRPEEHQGWQTQPVAFANLPPAACWLHQGLRSGFEVSYFTPDPHGLRIEGTTTGFQDGAAWVLNYTSK